MENIFENAKFKDTFLTADGRIVVLQRIVGNTAYLFTEDKEISVTIQGLTRVLEDCIVSRYQEVINEEELDKLAEEYEASLPESYTWNEPDYSESDEGLRGVCSVCEIEKAFKAGYKSAK